MTEALDLGDKPDLLAMRAGLHKLLTEGQDWRSAVRLIAMNPVLKAEAERILPLLDEALTPYPDRNAIADDLRARGADYALEAHILTPELLQPYTDALWADGVSPYVLSEAFRRWRAYEAYPKSPGRHDVYPKPAELMALAAKSHAIIAAMRFRVNKALAADTIHPAPKSDVDRAAVRAMASNWVRSAL